MRTVLLLAALLAPVAAAAESLVAARTIRAREIIAPGDIAIDRRGQPGALARVEDVIGREARITLYAGRPVTPGDVAEAAVIERNDIVVLTYASGVLSIRADGRSLGRGAPGTRVRVMNLASRATVTGTIVGPGLVSVP